jgi:4-diphosphocytidyl-2-C-methyl-D-erythritol kinase
MAIELGSDVPFFLCGSPLALAWSRGERLLSLPPLPPRPVVIAHPGMAMATPDAFRRVAEQRGGGYRPRSRSIPIEQLTDWATVAALAENDFQPVVAKQIPLIAEALDALRQSGATVALMAGSGSSVFGVFEAAAERDGAMERLRGMGMRVWAAETLEEGPDAGLTRLARWDNFRRA